MTSRTMTMTEQGKEEVWLLGHRGGRHTARPRCEQGLPRGGACRETGRKGPPKRGPCNHTGVAVGNSCLCGKSRREPAWARRKVCTLDAKLPPAS